MWITLDTSKSHLLPIAIENGFKYHHVEGDLVTLILTLESNTTQFVPPYSTHFIGVGGLVWDESTNEILVMQERVSELQDYWKIPGGLVDREEPLSEAMEREVWEETGVKAEFQRILAFRERKEFRYGKTDIYFIGLLKPISKEITIDPVEVSKAKWATIDEYLDVLGMHQLQNHVKTMIKTLYKSREQKKKVDIEFLVDCAGVIGHEYIANFNGRPVPGNNFNAAKLLHPEQDFNKSH